MKCTALQHRAQYNILDGANIQHIRQTKQAYALKITERRP